MTRLLTANSFFCALIISILLSCKTKSTEKTDETTNTQTQILSTENLPSQKFTINPERDTVIKGKSGTILRIYKNTFVTNDGKPATGDIEIELREAFSAKDILAAGLTTTSDGQFLETDGMLYVNASSGEQQLEIAKDKFIGVITPDAQIKKGMKLFEGELDSNRINWKNPKPILNDKLIAGSVQETPSATDSNQVKVRQANKGDLDAIFDYIESDTSEPARMVEKRKDKVVKQRVKESEEDVFLEEIENEKGINQFLEDYKTNYIFSLKKLGWANIDRLYEDPRTKEVDFITVIENQKEFKTIYVTLIVSNKSMYIPGYQRRDETFSFTHGDEETAQLPVGETATILATAYKEGKPYYAIQTIKISDKQRINIKLEATTEEKLKEALNKKI